MRITNANKIRTTTTSETQRRIDRVESSAMEIRKMFGFVFEGGLIYAIVQFSNAKPFGIGKRSGEPA